MIKEARELEPFIHFGFNKQNTTVAVNEDIIIWQDRLFSNDYGYSLVHSGNLVSSVLNKTILKFDTIGNYTIEMIVTYRKGTGSEVSKNSNTLTINVI